MRRYKLAILKQIEVDPDWNEHFVRRMQPVITTNFVVTNGWIIYIISNWNWGTGAEMIISYHIYILLKSIWYKQQTPAVTELDKQGSKGALTATFWWVTADHKGRVGYPRPVATVKTGHVRMCLLLVAQRDRSWLWRPILDLQHARWARCISKSIIISC